MNQAIRAHQPDGMHSLLKDIFATRPDEIQCDEAAIQMVLCADQFMTNTEARQKFPALFHHFRFCPDCAAEYQMLMELARLEAAGESMLPARILPRPPLDEATGNLLDTIQQIVRILFTGFTPAPALAVRGSALGLLPTAIELVAGKITVELDIDRSPMDPARRILFCRVETSGPELGNRLIGSPVWLTVENTGEVEQRQMLDEAAEATFDQLPPGRYQCWLRLAEQEYVVDGLTIP